MGSWSAPVSSARRWFDLEMRDHVASVQRSSGLVDDGEIGPFTFARLWPR